MEDHMEDLMRETYRTMNEVRRMGVTPKSIRAVMGSREAVQRLARRMPGAVRKTGFALDVLAADLGVGDGETLFHQLLDCPRRPELIERFTREFEAFFGEKKTLRSRSLPYAMIIRAGHLLPARFERIHDEAFRSFKSTLLPDSGKAARLHLGASGSGKVRYRSPGCEPT